MENFYSFFNDVIKERKQLQISEDETARIINCDQTPIFLEMPDTTTIDIKGKKEIIINTNGNEKKKNYVLLTIAGESTKIEHFLIFKGKRGKNVDKISDQYQHC